MATTSPAIDHTHDVVRSDSLASNLSSASNASLSRQPRTRGRTRTLTISSSRRGKSLGPPSASDYVPTFTAEELLAMPPLPLSGVSVESPVPGPERPPRSPLRVSASPVDEPAQQDMLPGPSNRAVDDLEGDRQARRIRVDEEAAKERRRRKRGSSVPREAYRLSLLSAASSPTSPFFPNHGPMQTMPHFPSLRETRQRLRESYLTHRSGTTTSAYPLSSSTVSGTDSPPSPRSLVDSFQDNRVTSVDPDEPGDEYRTFDADDVSYRLRLLVNNNYFLPPAHSKPSPLQLSPAVPPAKKPAKIATPFLDIFRGKSKTKPDCLDLQLPILRTTSDSTTTSGWVKRPHAQSLPISPISPHPRPQLPRVAVVREKMDDLVVAAKQAEQDIKAREHAQGRKSGQDMQLKEAPAPFDLVIDPTDAVDLPPQANDSPFAVQASALHGLGIEESVGAAILADRLPPSPGVWSLDPEEEAWRKALLHEAVGHSLNTTPAASSRVTVSPQSPTTSTSSRALTADESSVSRAPRSPTPSMKRNLGQRIVMPDEQEAVVALLTDPSLQRQLSDPPRVVQERRKLQPSNPNHPPERSESPATPHRPLAPAPRKQNGDFARVRPDSLGGDEEEAWRKSRMSTSSRGVRKAVSSPLLREIHESALHGPVSMTPPPLPRSRFASTATSLDHGSNAPIGHRPMDSQTSGSHYSEDAYEPDQMGTRPSFASSLPSRPSLSVYSQPSPTVSAFQDALYEGHEQSDSVRGSTSFESSATEQAEASPPHPPPLRVRRATISPPPRTSSSLGTTALFPPPRSSSFARSPAASRTQFLASPRPSVSSSSDPGHSHYVSATSMSLSVHETSLPPYPLGNRQPANSPARLQIPLSAVQRGPPVSSPIEFFDRIQMDHAMDEFETSDEESILESVGDSSVYDEARTRPNSSAVPPSPLGPPFVQGGSSAPFGNSTPSVSPSPSREDVSVIERSPVANVPPRPTYFKDAKGEQPLSNYELLQYARPADAAVERRPVTAEAEGSAKRGGRTPSLLRLDGLLIQHMEAERDTLSRIAKTAKETRP
ncbi:hypothetical protein BV25DRAFT_1913937 [Artomyces pyxidatus]|uniref:Uncharacterized protein n=1 Tax=Artomyces pyxidatus TaxID=48021 RepID=A0ACB8T878_9AGAM|nr:hypothetical protein BV25DRAFT_1913937 [Artomyces pyxidatus]